MSERDGVRIHPTAVVSAEATIGRGTSIWHWVHVRERAVIGRECIVGQGAYIDFEVVVGDHCKIQNGAFLYHPAILGDGVFVGPGVILTNDRRPRAVNPDLTLKAADDWIPAPVTIGEGAAIGAGAILLPGVRVGAWSLVAAGSVVSKDVPDHALFAGNPARLAGYVCSCGARLEKAGEGEYRCGECGQIYVQLAGKRDLRQVAF